MFRCEICTHYEDNLQVVVLGKHGNFYLDRLVKVQV